MKIKCDVCDKDEALVFCVADEAALCSACDHRVHHANKLAGKHQRFSLLQPSPKQVPLCDICQERRAFLFCQQDRAILCKECDIPIHKANEHTQKHNRFLLTGVKLSATSSLYSSESQSPVESASSPVPNNNNNNNKNKNSSDGVPNIKPQESRNRTIPTPSSGTTPNAKSTNVSSSTVAPPQSCDKTSSNLITGGNLNSPITTSSISEYLIEMLPGWHVEDFLDSASPSPYGFCKNGGDNDVHPFLDAGNGNGSSNMNVLPTEKFGMWVPQAPPPPPPPLHHQTQNQAYHQSMEIAFGASDGYYKEQSSKEFTFNNNNNYNNNYNNNRSSSRKWSEDNSFTVPQITPPSTNVPKRSRIFW